MKTFLALAICVLSLTACGISLPDFGFGDGTDDSGQQSAPDKQFVSGEQEPGLKNPVCGYNFANETDLDLVNQFHNRLYGSWVSEAPGFTVEPEGAEFPLSKSAFYFGSSGYGFVTLYYNHATAQPYEFAAKTSPEHFQVRIGKPLKTPGFETYRPIETYRASKDTCQATTSLFELSPTGLKLKLIGRASSMYVGSGTKPSVEELTRLTRWTFNKL